MHVRVYLCIIAFTRDSPHVASCGKSFHTMLGLKLTIVHTQQHQQCTKVARLNPFHTGLQKGAWIV